MEEVALAAALRARRTKPAPQSGPTVSIVVATRNGADHLRRLLDGLDRRTNYHPIELVVVDNDSTDESIELLEQWPSPVEIVRNASNQSFSASNNQGVRAATGDYVLLANNDIDPINPDWLGFMVQTLEAGAAVVGAMLVYPTREPRAHPPDHPDLTIQHLGTCFERSKWGVRAANSNRGDDPLSVSEPGVREVPAVTAACLLARRTDLLAFPLDEEYWYGTEDWDLCLRIRERGPVMIDERAALFHHEYGTQDQYMSEEWLAARTRNHHWFNELWAPSIMRRLRAELTGPPSDYFFRTRTSPRLLLLGSERTHRAEMEQLRAQAQSDGWEVAHDERGGGDVVVALDPPRWPHRFAAHDVSIAVVTDQHDTWARSGSLDVARHVLVPVGVGEGRLAATWGRGVARTYDASRGGVPDWSTQLLPLVPSLPDAMRIGISTAAPSWDKAQVWGDTFLARGLMRAFGRLGHETTELIRPDWRSAIAASCDVVIHLRGLHRRSTARGQWNILWVISHPDRVEPDEYDDYDIIASASRAHAEELSDALGRHVHFVPQATDCDTFHIGPRDVDFEVPVLYVGIARWPNRRAPRWMARNGRSFHLYGRNWEEFAEGRFLRDEHIPNRDLAAAYRSASIVVADHHGSMRTGGFVANRIFDVLASGGLVLSDDVTGLDGLFGEVVPTYGDAGQLEAQLRRLLADAPMRRQLSREGRALVEAHHTLDHRAAQFLELLDEL